MYQSIYEYARSRDISKEKNRCQRKIACYILLDENGVYEETEIIPKKDRSSSRCPDVGKYYTAGMASPVCDKKQTIFGDIKHDSFIELMKQGEMECNAFQAVNIFLDNIANDDDLRCRILNEIVSIKDTEFISFRIDGINLEENSSWEEWFDHLMEEKQSTSADSFFGVSMLSGKNTELIAGKRTFPMCKGASAFGTGVPLFSTSHKKESGAACAFKSYGAGTEACPMSIEEAETIQAGIEKLMSSEHNHSDDFSILYWFDEDVPDTIGPLLSRSVSQKKKDEAKEKEYKELLESIISGEEKNLKKDGKDLKYHIIKYNVPDKGRFSLSREKSGTYNELAISIKRWLEDTALESKNNSTMRLNNIWSLMFGLMEKKDPQDKMKEIKNEYGDSRDKLIDSVFMQKQIPYKVLQLALRQIGRSMVYNYYNTDDETIKVRYSPWTALMVLKAYLIREGEKMQKKLDTENANIGYLCGRWLATMDKLQSDSQRESNSKTTMGQKMYKGCTKQPARVLNLCSENKGVYLGKLDPRYRKSFEDTFGEIADKMPQGFPDRFTVTEEAAFHMGYAQQRQEFYRKKENKIEAADNNNAEADEGGNENDR